MASVQVASPASSSASQQFCLRWNNYQANLTSVFDQLLQSEVFVDVTLACDGHSVKAHKMVLSACSPYFQALFCDNPCKHPIVILKDVKWPELKAVVEFMYRGEINVLQEQIAPLLRVAETLRVRGLADVAASEPPPHEPSSSEHRPRKRARRHSGESPTGAASGPPTPPFELLESMAGVEPAVAAAVAASLASLAPVVDHQPPQQQPPQQPPPQQQMQPPPQQQQQQQQQQQSVVDDLEIKPGIAEMILEEERAKLLESSHAWLGASTSSINDSYQYQLQSMWQKCWNTNQSLVHNLRFRERGPLKSWRPETMAEAIFSVLKEGLSLSQAARKFDIPYPTFVLYANRVHNMLGPSADGGADLRPKGRGRPQRILLGVWPEEHIRGVIRAVVFRDPAHIKEEAQTLARLYCMQDPMGQSGVGAGSQFPALQAAANGQQQHQQLSEGGGGRSATPTPSSAAAAAVAAVAQGLRQQMCGLAAPGGDGQQGPSSAAVAALASALLGREAAASEHHQAATALNNNTLGGLRGHHSLSGLSSMAAFQKPLYQRPPDFGLDDTEAAGGGHVDPHDDDALKALDAPPTVAE